MTYEEQKQNALVLQEGLREIAGMGVSQPIGLNMPSDKWYRRLFIECQHIAHRTLEEAEGKTDA